MSILYLFCIHNSRRDAMVVKFLLQLKAEKIFMSIESRNWQPSQVWAAMGIGFYQPLLQNFLLAINRKTLFCLSANHPCTDFGFSVCFFFFSIKNVLVYSVWAKLVKGVRSGIAHRTSFRGSGSELSEITYLLWTQDLQVRHGKEPTSVYVLGWVSG